MPRSLGGKKAITAVVNDFAGRSATDARISSFFKRDLADAGRPATFNTDLLNQICEVAGGPCKYIQARA